MANTLAYYDTATITAVKSFIVQAPASKLECLFLARIVKALSCMFKEA
jgi:hypothetical protein